MEALRDPIIMPQGFREYDARWRFPDQINLPGLRALGLGLGTQMQRRGIKPAIVVGHDFRAYSLSVQNALMLGLIEAGITVHDIGLSLSPMAYFAQTHLGGLAVAMVTASHNPNGWTGVKMGFHAPLTHGPEDMAELREIVLSGQGQPRPGGGYIRVAGVKDAYLEDLIRGYRLSRPLRVVCATGNGTAGDFAPKMLRRIGAEVIPRHITLDDRFPHYNPNPEAPEMLADMAAVQQQSGADLALGFDGDGDRCGVVDDTGSEIFADKMGVILARDLIQHHPKARFIVDVKSTGLFASDPVLQRAGAQVEYWKTGHSHMKRRVAAQGALAGFEKSGHYFFAQPLGQGYDCGLRVALEICKLLDRNPDQSLSALYRALPKTWLSPTLSPSCADDVKYDVVGRIVQRIQTLFAQGAQIAGQRIAQINTVNGVRVTLENGSWGLVRASSNTPNLVVVVESTRSETEMRQLFAELMAFLSAEPAVGPCALP